MSELANALTVAESDYLTECEDRIERGLQTFVEVGTALAMIRDNKLYRAGHLSFAAYCEERWGFSDRRARQIIDAATIGTIVPVENEGQARELARVPEPDRTRVWDAAVEATAGKPTAAAIRAAATPSQPAAPAEADAQLDRDGARTTDAREAETGTAPVEVGGGAGGPAIPSAPQTAVDVPGAPSTDAPGEEAPLPPSVRAGAAPVSAPRGADTGVTPSPVEEFLARDPALQAADYLAAFTSALSRAGGFMSFDAERVAQLAGSSTWDAVEAHASVVAHWFATAQKARRGLRVIKGGVA